METPTVNQLVLTACVVRMDTLRHTPAGIPALNLELEHESTVQEAGQARQVKANVKAVAFAVQAERMSRQSLGSGWQFSGFMAAGRNGKGLVFHIQDLSPI